jgi:cation/acetate symporter
MFGGMVATTWIQIVKATLLLLTCGTMVFLLLRQFGFDPDAMVGAALQARPQQHTGRLLPDPFSAASLGLSFALGPAGLPHVLMRCFTVKDARSARRSLSNATIIIAVFQFIVILLGYGAAALVPGDAGGGANMAAIHLARILGGDVLFGVAAAVTFATILAVVSGLTLAAASAVSYDLYKHGLRRGQVREASEMRVSKLATVVLGVVAIVLGIVFRNQPIGFLATLPLVIAASVNFPLLILTMYWRGLTTRGAVAGGVTGLVLSVALILLSPKVWCDVFGFAAGIFPYEYPTVFSLGAALLVAFVVSVRDRSVRATLARA